MTWWESASCRQVGQPDLWYTTEQEPMQQALDVCSRCPVRHPCLLTGLHDKHGVWGGHTPEQRQALIDRLPADTSTHAIIIKHAATLGPRNH